MGEIYLRHGDRYVAMHETPYDAEDVLQELIERHPEMLAGGESRQSLILIRREAGINDAEEASARWSLDHLYVDRQGIPTLVEVKRSSDTRSRREVVAQMLDYAAHARTSFNVERMADWLDEAARQHGSTGAETLLGVFGIEDVDGFWQDVDTNLKAERLRLVFVSDNIGPELRSIIEFLNRQMSATEVLAIEVKQYTDDEGEHQTIVPRLVGDTAQARAVKRPAARGEPLDHDQVVAKLREHDDEAALAADAILGWAERNSRLDVRYTRGLASSRLAARRCSRSGHTRTRFDERLKCTSRLWPGGTSRGMTSTSNSSCGIWPAWVWSSTRAAGGQTRR